MVDMIKLATSISAKIRDLERARSELTRLAQDVGQSEGAYRKKLAVTCMGLKNGVSFTLDDTTIESPPAATALTIAHGICAKEKIEAQTAEVLWRSQLKICDMLMSELDGLRSINKNLSDIE